MYNPHQIAADLGLKTHEYFYLMGFSGAFAGFAFLIGIVLIFTNIKR